MSPVWCVYLVSLILELIGLALGGWDLRSRGKQLSCFAVPPSPRLPPWFNEHESAARILTDAESASTIQRQREVNNELIDAIDRFAIHSKIVDEELADIAGVGRSTWQLWVAAVLVFVGAVGGGIGNLLAAGGG